MTAVTRNSLAILLSTLLAGTAQAGPTIELNAEASRPAANDMIHATVYSEASGKNPADLARQVNQDIAEALKVIKAKAGVTVKSGQQNTYPIYGQNQKIDNWRMRSELLLESKDVAVVSELIGKLQQMRLALGNINQLPSPETRQKVEDDTTRDAIRAFQARAVVVANIFGKPYRIKELRVQQDGGFPLPPMERARPMAAAAAPAPMPIEAGESQVTTSISGQIELAD